jgi:hypothetical protein
MRQTFIPTAGIDMHAIRALFFRVFCVFRGSFDLP